MDRTEWYTTLSRGKISIEGEPVISRDGSSLRAQAVDGTTIDDIIEGLGNCGALVSGNRFMKGQDIAHSCDIRARGGFLPKVTVEAYDQESREVRLRDLTVLSIVSA